MKKVLMWTMLLYLLDIAIGTLLIQYFDVIGFAEKYSEEIVHGMLLGLIGWVIVKKYKRLRFREKTRNVNIQLWDG